LASIGTRGVPPYKGVLTHGFVVDSRGKKMSKSIGNVIAPEEIIKKYGAEILRLWVSSEDYRDDIKISDEILNRLSDAYRKIRNTIRYLLGNLSDFDPAQDSVSFSDMGELDRWALSQFEVVKRKVIKAYEDFDFHTVFQTIPYFCNVTMSAFYLDILKDRLYTEYAVSPARRASQTVLYEILDGLLRLMSPVLSFTAAEVWPFLPADANREENVFVARFPSLKDEYLDEELNTTWGKLQEIRTEITKVLEVARREKLIGHSLEAEVSVTVSGELEKFLTDKWDTLAMICIVSGIKKVGDAGPDAVTSELYPEMSIDVRAAETQKCERCWMRSETVGQDMNHPQICGRCSTVMAQIDGQG
jgi:isoleucyl-tRNA synthetase